MAAAKKGLCTCGSGRVATFACLGQRWCFECIDGTDDRPSMQSVHDSPEGVAARASHGDRPSDKPTPAAGSGGPSRTPSPVPEPAPTTVPIAPQGFVTRPSINGGTTTMRATTIRQPSPKSVAFLRTLLDERAGVTEAEAIREVLNRAREDEALDQSLVSSCIDTLRKIAKPRSDRTLPTPGQPAYEHVVGNVHVIDGDYYRIHRSQNTGGCYACKFDGERFEYVKGGIRLCTAANLCTAEQAAAFGHLHHACVFCARRLDTPESTAVGYGPVCADKHGLPWG